jgi:hypothetical protein
MHYSVEDSSLVAINFKTGTYGIVDSFFNIPRPAARNGLELNGTKGSIVTERTIGQESTGKLRLEVVGQPVKEWSQLSAPPVTIYRAEVEDMASEAVLVRAQAEANGQFLGEKVLTLNLPPLQGEMDEVALDRDFLKEFSDQTGAAYLDLNQLGPDTAAKFPATTETVEMGIASAWRRWPVLIVLCALLVGNWFFRRFIGLV